VKINVPTMGNLETKVSKQAADHITIFSVGGLVALLGVVLGIFLGVPPRRS
jgi:hypothetical protein